MKDSSKTLLTLLIGLSVGAVAGSVFWPSSSDSGKGSQGGEKEPLYWVAPMDSNYRRDEPGKSPMGMDLVPVYEEDSSADKHGPGTVTIEPHVQNNLGVRTGTVKRGIIDNTIKTVGYVQYDEDRLVHLHPRVEGWIETLYVKAAGDPVEQGQPVYTLYSPQLVNAQEELLIALKRGNQALIGAARERLSALQMSAPFIDRLEQSRQVQHSITFYAPQSGVVDGLNIREGFYVKPGTTLMSIGQLDSVWVEAEVFERDAGSIQPGLPVTMTLDYLPGREWQGSVDYVYPSLNATTRTLRVRLKFENPDNTLRPNMFAQVSIQTAVTEPELLVPKEAVIRTGKQERVVLALGDGAFKSIAVTLGRVGDDAVEVLEGLNEGDTVVTSAQFLIDSESSKNSDFTRMSPQSEPDSVWVEGEVNSVDIQSRTANLDHGPADAWDWPAMTMDFAVGDSVDINALSQAKTLHFEVTKTDSGDYVMTAIHVMSEKSASQDVASATVDGTINTIDAETRVLNISRGPIEKWSRPATTMDFVAAESIDLSAFSVGQEVTFTFEIRDEFVIVSMSAKGGEHAHHDMTEEDV
ncbi:Cation efflux system protein CusB [Saliniradius amylolyticus]|uniref:Cation efflux system protein CusB n=1 Tax=Saliniradius amylolyticus TaxID=2183582 RepID=A0A2S2E4Z7_9ALTE|nr:efflux RND transporter periplasmic adaptor subunit [Saliniradius amylolyticus]AWL12310.1 Cation efflux system protein CusB [Saliniradius amylolyticus]